jgi:Flp pilus assembly protein TadB
MHLLTIVLEHTVEAAVPTFSKLLSCSIPAVAATSTYLLSKKQKRKIKWQFLKEGFKNTFKKKKEKGNGSTILLLLLLLIGGLAVLWILWELGGVFALILGIVGALGLLSLILKSD